MCSAQPGFCLLPCFAFTPETLPCYVDLHHDVALLCDTQELDVRVRTINGAIGEARRLSVGV